MENKKLSIVSGKASYEIINSDCFSVIFEPECFIDPNKVIGFSYNGEYLFIDVQLSDAHRYIGKPTEYYNSYTISDIKSNIANFNKTVNSLKFIEFEKDNMTTVLETTFVSPLIVDFSFRMAKNDDSQKTWTFTIRYSECISAHVAEGNSVAN